MPPSIPMPPPPMLAHPPPPPLFPPHALVCQCPFWQEQLVSCGCPPINYQ
uniref:Uncharacterized protein n=1 Tax=Meloidogyne floridensis TaxID=298350 RepID=A0A915P521_9BILA